LKEQGTGRTVVKTNCNEGVFSFLSFRVGGTGHKKKARKNFPQGLQQKQQAVKRGESWSRSHSIRGKGGKARGGMKHPGVKTHGVRDKKKSS